jgi:hypothetical protein
MTADVAAARTARLLGDRLDALARALQAAGADPEVAARLLGTAAAAAMDAVTLVQLSGEAAGDPAVEQAGADEIGDLLRLAA